MPLILCYECYKIPHTRPGASVLGSHSSRSFLLSLMSSTRASSLHDREHLDDRHAPPWEHDRARWASAGDAGVTMHQLREESIPDPPAAWTSFAAMVTKIKAEVDTLHASAAVYDGGPGDCFLRTSPHTRSPSPTSPTSSRSVINGFRLKEAARRGDMDRVASLAVAIPRLARQGGPEGVLDGIPDCGSSRLPCMADKAAARAEKGDDKGKKVDDRFKRSGRQLTPSGFDLKCDMQPESAAPSESLPPAPTRDHERLHSALDGQTPSSEQDRSSPPPLPGKIPPDMLEKAELCARLERLDLLQRLASVRTEEDSAVSTRSSSLRPRARDHEPLHDRHAPPSEQDGARWASAGGVGVTMHQQRQEHPVAQSLVSMVTKIKAEVDTLHTVSALYDRARPQTPADEAGMVAPRHPSPTSLNRSPLAVMTSIPEEITEVTDCSGPHDAPPLECSLESELSSAGTPLASEAQSATDNTKLEAAEYISEESAAPSIWRCDARTDSGLSECKMSVASRVNSCSMDECPDHQETSVCGQFTIKGTMDNSRSMRAKCYMNRCMLTLIIPQQAFRDSSGGGIQSNGLAVHILVEELVVRLPQVRTDAFEIGTLHENRMNNVICCFADSQAERDEWIATFRRMGVAIFD